MMFKSLTFACAIAIGLHDQLNTVPPVHARRLTLAKMNRREDVSFALRNMTSRKKYDVQIVTGTGAQPVAVTLSKMPGGNYRLDYSLDRESQYLSLQLIDIKAPITNGRIGTDAVARFDLSNPQVVPAPAVCPFQFPISVKIKLQESWFGASSANARAPPAAGAAVPADNRAGMRVVRANAAAARQAQAANVVPPVAVPADQDQELIRLTERAIQVGVLQRKHAQTLSSENLRAILSALNVNAQ